MKKRHASRHHGNSPSYLLMVGIGMFCGFFLGLHTRNIIIPCAEDISAGAGLDELRLSHRSSNIHPGIPTANQSQPRPIGNRKQLVLIGVMTARKYLKTRVVAAYNTWATTIPGQVIFFASEGSDRDFPPGIPIVSLKGTDDTYPPQKKSFMMIKYMHDHYLDQFEYFMRADDDVYIRGDKLAEFLYSINGTKTFYIGQAGQGNKEEIGLLNLEGEENFCMGGPSMVFSQPTLAKMVPHTSYCLKNLYTSHEDVEIGRCVLLFADVHCTWAFEVSLFNLKITAKDDSLYFFPQMQRLFLNNYKEPNGSFDNSLHTKDVQRAITLHPVKNHTYQYRIHHHFLMQRAADLRQDILRAHREIHAMNEILQDRDAFYSPNRLGLPPSLLKTVPKTHEEVLPWDFISGSIYSLKSANPKHGLDVSLREGLDDVVGQTMEMINKNARQRGRTIDFQKVLYGYQRVNPLHGADYVLDLLLVYRKHKGKRRMTVPVRRHAYLQQTFAPIEFTELDSELSSVTPPATKPALFDMLHDRLGRWYDPSRETKIPSDHRTAPNIHFILPLSGRFQTFLQFMHSFEEACLRQSAYKITLAVMLYRSETEDHIDRTIDIVRQMQQKYPEHSLHVVQMEGVFSRGVALMEGSRLFSNDSLLFFIDVDIDIRRDVLYRIVHNVRQGQQVYYPIVFSQYDPVMTCPADTNCDSELALTANKGYWRQFGYGIAAMYKSDLLAVGGFDTSIQGWGKEDVELFSSFLARNMTVLRSADPGLVHVFHPVVCDPQLDSAQYQMCLGSKAATAGAVGPLAEFVYRTPEILDRGEPEENLNLNNNNNNNNPNL